MNFPNILRVGTESDKCKSYILSYFLYTINDLETFIEKNNVPDLKTLSDELEQELGYYV